MVRLTGLQVVDGVELVEQGAGAEQGSFPAGPGAAADDGHAHVRPQKRAHRSRHSSAASRSRSASSLSCIYVISMIFIFSGVQEV